MFKKIVVSVALSLVVLSANAQSATQDLNSAYLIAVECNSAMDYRRNVHSVCSRSLEATKVFLSRHKNTSQPLDFSKMIYIIGTNKRIQEYWGK